MAHPLVKNIISSFIYRDVRYIVSLFDLRYWDHHIIWELQREKAYSDIWNCFIAFQKPNIFETTALDLNNVF